MNVIRNKVCGIDVHKKLLVKLLVGTILDRSGNKQTNEFSNTVQGIYLLRNWIYQEKCEVVAFESTGDYWIQLYNGLEPVVPIEVANAYHIKHFPGKKTDILDSEWIAQLALNLTRYRALIVRQRTVQKNKIHHILDSSSIRLSHVLTDIFGKTGIRIMNCLVDGGDMNEILDHLPRNLRKRREKIKEAVSYSLSQQELHMLRSCLRLINSFNSVLILRSRRLRP